MKFNLRGKIIFLAFAAALIPTVVMIFLVISKEQEFGNRLTTKLESISDQQIGGSARNVYEFCGAANELMQDKLKAGLDLTKIIIREAGGLAFDGPEVEWDAINQFTKESIPVTLPALQVGGQVVPPDASFMVPMPVVDEANRLTGNTCTIFQRMNAEGDMLRVASTVPTQNSERAIGSFIPVTNADGESNSVLALVLVGIPFRGAAYVVDKWMITLYEPIKDEYGEIIGMLYQGVEMDSLPGLRNNVRDQSLGESGYIRIFRGEGKGEGGLVLQSLNDETGVSLWDAIDADGESYIQKIVEESNNLAYGEVGTLTVHLTPPGGTEPELLYIKFTVFQPWNWIITANGFYSDFSETEEQIRDALAELKLQSGAFGLFALLVASLLAWVLAQRISKPIGNLTNVAEYVAEGDLHEGNRAIGQALLEQKTNQKSAVAIFRGDTKDETNVLTDAFGRMISQLNSLVSKVKGSSLQLVTTASQITATARQQERNVQDFGVSSNEIAAAVKEISATSQELLATMDDVTTVASDTAEMADDGRKSLGEMENAMRRLAKATRSISSKLSVINEKANNIGVVISTISDVADQTNLLSLNAAIEAEKAGSAGQGFAVVAREIRRLADQTAVSTLDIEDLVKEMQSSVSSGVMEMDKFSDEVRTGVDETVAISKQFGGIIEQVQALTPRFEMVHEGMASQHAGANQINEAMLKLTESAKQSGESLREFNEAADQLRHALGGLKEEVAKFKTIHQDTADTVAKLTAQKQENGGDSSS